VGSPAEDIIATAARVRQSKISLAKTDYNEFAELILKDQKTGKPIQQGMAHELWTEIRRRHKRAVIIGHVEAGKALPLTTPIPTTKGWVLLRDLRQGDLVFDMFGAPCSVTALSPIEHDKPGYRLQFHDNTEIEADADHRWLVHDGDSPDLRVATTLELVAGYEPGRWSIPLAGPVQYPESKLPIHPYTLGVWLGAGNKDGAVFACPLAQADMVSRACDLDGERENVSVVGDTIKSFFVGSSKRPRLNSRLRELGLLGAKNIPEIFLTASIQQRVELLAGICDALATVELKSDKNIICIPLSAELATPVIELVRSLGNLAVLYHPTEGRFAGKHTVVFETTTNPFRARAKRNLFAIVDDGTEPEIRLIRRIIPAEPATVRCITVSSATRSYLAGRNYVVTHNTQQFSVGVPIHELGKNPRMRMAIVSKTHEQAVKIVRTQMGYISRSRDIADVYPHLKPGTLWSEKFGFSIEREGEIVEPSVQAIGYRKAVSGARLDGIILDDFLDSVNTNTKRKRDEADDWFHSELVSRLTDEAWVYFLGNAWHNDDLYHRLERSGWPTYRFPVKVSKEMVATFPEVRKPVHKGGWGRKVGDLSWPEVYTEARIATKKADLDALHPYECARQLYCTVRDDAASAFRQSWIDTALKSGEDVPYCHTAEEFGRWDTGDLTEAEKVEFVISTINGEYKGELDGYDVITGVDLSTGKATDTTQLATIAINKRTFKRFLINLEGGLWQVDDIIQHIRDVHSRYGGVFVVENNGGQDFIVQLLHGHTAIPVYPHTTGLGKMDPLTGIEVLAAEMHNKKWVFPSKGLKPNQDSVTDLIDEMLSYSAESRRHTGDRLMSLWMAQSAASKFERCSNSSPSRVTII
jgi:hypothetical protein